VVLKKYPDAICIPVGYSKPFPVEHITSSDDRVIIVDYSFSNAEELEAILAKTRDIIWIDHHVTSVNLKIPKYDGDIPGSMSLIPGIRVNKTPAACLLCWQYFFPQEKVPLAILLVSDYDTWAFSYGEITRLFNKGLSCQADPSNSIWKDLFGPIGDFTALPRIVEQGGIILRHEDYVNQKILENASFETIFHGHSAIVINSMWGNKDIFKGGPEKDVYIKMYFDGKFWNVTLYSSKVNCEELAKKYGGGGHVGSAGMKTTAFPFWETNPLNKDVMDG
jgi:hypothetical protein